MKLVKIEKYERHSESIPNKHNILRYMKRGRDWAAAPRTIKDRFTGKSTGIEDYWCTDGIFAWSSDVIYHFEKYNVPLPSDFLEYMLTVALKK